MSFWLKNVTSLTRGAEWPFRCLDCLPALPGLGLLPLFPSQLKCRAVPISLLTVQQQRNQLLRISRQQQHSIPKSSIQPGIQPICSNHPQSRSLSEVRSLYSLLSKLASSGWNFLSVFEILFWFCSLQNEKKLPKCLWEPYVGWILNRLSPPRCQNIF